MTIEPNSILIVEDDRAIREALQLALELEGYPVATASHGHEALDLLEKNNTKPKLILLDLMMPVMNGWEFLEARKSNSAHAEIPVIVITAAGDAAAKSVQVNGFLKKPIELETLFSAIRPYCV